MENYFYKNLKYLRETRKISQQYIADKIGVDRSTIGYWESKKAEPIMLNVIKIAELFNIELKDLILKDLETNTSPKIPTNDEEYKQILKDKGLMDENENINPEDFKKLVDFAVANKDFIIKKDRD